MNNSVNSPKNTLRAMAQNEKRAAIQRAIQRFDKGLLFDLARVATFNDAVIAIAITLLVLDIRPAAERLGSNAAIMDELRRLLPNILAFALSFWVISRFWISNQVFFRGLRHMDIGTLQLNVLFLALIAWLPFPTSLLAIEQPNQVVVVLYATTLLAASITQVLMWQRLAKADRRSDEVSESFIWYQIGRYFAAAVFFAISIPLAFWSVYAGVAVWLLFGFTNLFRERSTSSVQGVEEYFRNRGRRRIERRSQRSR